MACRMNLMGLYPRDENKYPVYLSGVWRVDAQTKGGFHPHSRESHPAWQIILTLYRVLRFFTVEKKTVYY